MADFALSVRGVTPGAGGLIVGRSDRAAGLVSTCHRGTDNCTLVGERKGVDEGQG